MGGPAPAAPARHADILGAHARLAAIHPAATEDRLLGGILGALLVGAGAGRGILVDPARPEAFAAQGLVPDADALRILVRQLSAPRASSAPVPPGILASHFRDGDSVPSDPRAIPVTAHDETLCLLLLEAPPADPVGFASLTAHAASLLATIRMSEKVQKADFELKYRVWELESLYDVGLSIARTLDLDSLADDILLKSVSLLNARTGTLIVHDVAGDGGALAKHFGEPLVDDAAARDLPAHVLRFNTVRERTGPLASSPAEKLLSVPILAEGRRLGVLVVADKENRAGGIDDFTEGDERILSLFANQAAIALENARLHREAVEKERIEREIELAAGIQKTILPETLPEVPGLLLAGGNRPTRQVGGDYFDVYPLPDGRTAFCVADVSGKGVPAALLVSTVHACLHLLIPSLASDLPALVARVNRHLVGFSATRKFATLFVAVYDPARHALTYVNAGHNPAIWVAEGAVTLLPSGGLPIGMMPNVVHKEATIQVSAGDTLVVYSDGITEALDAEDREFGMDRLTGLVVEGRDSDPAGLSQRIFAAVSDFTRGVAQYDDQTVLIARVR